MKRTIVVTSDGSKTIQIADWEEQYHSKHGAIQEAYHVFITAGLRLFSKQPLSILEIGFGTGLNALITFLEYNRLGLGISYTGVEAYPVTNEELVQLNYTDELHAKHIEVEFKKMHESPWETWISLSDNFSFRKQQKDFFKIGDIATYNLIYFDAFGARVQPELWTEVLFAKMFTALKEEGILVTYAAKGSVRRAMLAVGFEVERLPGPPGKREMLRAKKPKNL